MKIKVAIITAVIISTISLVMFLSSIKEQSTNGRMLVLQNAFQLFQKKPMFGNGFGLFEKNYNQFIAENNLPSQGYVKMAYNDFIELSIDGGIIANILWLCFLGSIVRHAAINKLPISPIIAFLVIQLSNFGFQALPAFLLFILYSSLQSLLYLEKISTDKVLMKQPFVQTFWLYVQKKGIIYFNIAFALFSIYGLYKALLYSKGFYNIEQLKANANYKINVIGENMDLEKTMNEFSIYNVLRGDFAYKTGSWNESNSSYKKALLTTHNPAVLIKCGYSFLKKGTIDSALQYFKMACIIEPKKLQSKMALLQAYELKGDSIMIKNTATQILETPIVGDITKGNEIKKYAELAIRKNQK